MVWFVNTRDRETKRIWLHCRHQGATYTLTLVNPNGSETTTTFVDEDSMIAKAVEIHFEHVDDGWQAPPRAH